MKRLILVASVVVAATAAAPSVEPAIPIRTLAPPLAVSPDTFGLVLSMRHLPDGHVLINDGLRRRVVRLDSMLKTTGVVLDSTSGSASAYGPFRAPFISYLGDTVLFPDNQAQVLLLIGPDGKVARTIAPPTARDLGSMTQGNSATDPQGRLVYRVPMRLTVNLPTGGMQTTTNPDSAVLVRTDFVTRVVDTLAVLRTSTGRRNQLVTGPNGERIMRTTVNPLPQLDEWAMLANGDIALIRGTDYHIDWIRGNGVKASTPKMEFDWRKLTDDDKQRLIDSAKKAFDEAQAAPPTAGAGGRGDAVGNAAAAAAAGGARGFTMGAVQTGGAGGGTMTPIELKQETEFVPLSEIVDYYPPMRSGAAKADRDGNLWILTATSAQSKDGELVYDVVNAKGELFQRVRLPVGRALVGFGPKGVVYLMVGSLAKGFILERTHLSNAS